MIVCKNCYIPMIGVISFSKDKHERFSRCPKCYSETHHQRIKDDDINFGEELYKKLEKETERWY